MNEKWKYSIVKLINAYFSLWVGVGWTFDPAKLAIYPVWQEITAKAYIWLKENLVRSGFCSNILFIIFIC